jgi:hypothetical protein
VQVIWEHRVLDLVLDPVGQPRDLGVRAGVALAQVLVADFAELRRAGDEVMRGAAQISGGRMG